MAIHFSRLRALMAFQMARCSGDDFTAFRAPLALIGGALYSFGIVPLPGRRCLARSRIMACNVWMFVLRLLPHEKRALFMQSPLTPAARSW